MMIPVLPDQQNGLDIHTASSLKQQSTDKHVTSLWYIILTWYHSLPSLQHYAYILEKP